MTAPVESQPTESLSRRLPPVAELTVASLVLVVVGGIFMASYFPRRPPLAVPISLFIASGILVVVGMVMLSQVHDFAWQTFTLVGRWALLAYVLQAGMIEYAFVRNHASGAPLVVVTLLLLLFAVDPPLIISFTVARYQST
jgi:hypothetical protein